MKLAINATYNPSGGSLTQLINMTNYFSKMDDINIDKIAEGIVTI